jgi:hypothetical protein
MKNSNSQLQVQEKFSPSTKNVKISWLVSIGIKKELTSKTILNNLKKSGRESKIQLLDLPTRILLANLTRTNSQRMDNLISISITKLTGK